MAREEAVMALKAALKPDFAGVLREFRAIEEEEKMAEHLNPDTAKLMQDMLEYLNNTVHPEGGGCKGCQLVGRIERWLVANGVVPEFVFNDGK